MTDAPPPIISREEQLDNLKQRLMQQIATNDRRIRLSTEEEELLVTATVFNGILMHRLLEDLRHAAREAGWGPRELAQLSFKYLNEAIITRRKLSRNVDNVVDMSGRERSQTNQQRQRRNERPIADAETMMDADDPMMRIAGVLMYFREKRIWWDDFHKGVRLDWRGGTNTDKVPAFALDDPTVLRIMVWARTQDPELSGVGKQVFVDAIELMADLDHRNEVREWLEGLKWDGVSRAAELAPRYYHTVDTEYTRAVSLNLLVGMVARVLDPGCQYDHMVVLIGGQGLFKSQSLRALGGAWYRSLQAGIDSNDFVRLINSAWLVELPELSSMTSSRSHAEATKARLSTQIDSLVPKYKNFPAEMKRSSVPVGTTNDEHFHHDPTSDDARRYLPLFVSIDGQMIELAKIKEDREQLFAEALVLYRAGHKFWDIPRDAQREVVATVRRVNEFLDKVAVTIERWEDTRQLYDGIIEGVEPTRHNGGGEDRDHGTLVTIERVAKALGLTTVHLRQQGNANAIGQALQHLGFTRKQVRVRGTMRLSIWQRAWPSRQSDIAPARRVVTRGAEFEDPGQDFPF